MLMYPLSKRPDCDRSTTFKSIISTIYSGAKNVFAKCVILSCLTGLSSLNGLSNISPGKPYSRVFTVQNIQVRIRNMRHNACCFPTENDKYVFLPQHYTTPIMPKPPP